MILRAFIHKMPTRSAVAQRWIGPAVTSFPQYTHLRNTVIRATPSFQQHRQLRQDHNIIPPTLSLPQNRHSDRIATPTATPSSLHAVLPADPTHRHSRRNIPTVLPADPTHRHSREGGNPATSLPRADLAVPSTRYCPGPSMSSRALSHFLQMVRRTQPFFLDSRLRGKASTLWRH